MSAPELSAEEAAVVARFGIFAEEETVERVARAIDKALDSPDPTDWMPRSLARAAVTAMSVIDCGQAMCTEAAKVRRVEALAEVLEAPVFRAAVLLPDRDMGRQEGEDEERRRIAAAIRAALRPADVTGGQR